MLRAYRIVKKCSPLISYARTTLHTFAHSRATRNAFFYAAGSIVLRALSMGLSLLFIRVISPAQYGVLALITSGIYIATTITSLGLRQHVALEFFHADATQQRTLIGEVLVAYTLAIMPFVCAALLGMPLLTARYTTYEITYSVLICTIVAVVFHFFAELGYQLMQYHEHARTLTGVQLIVTLITSIGAFIAVCGMRVGFVGILAAQALNLCALSCILWLFFLRDAWQLPALTCDLMQRLARHVRASMPFIPAMLCAWIMSSSNRALLARYASLEAVGIYAVADTISQLFYLVVIYPWSGSYHPYIMKQFAAHTDCPLDVEQWNERVMYASMSILICASCVAYWLCKPWAALLLPACYHAALPYALGIVVASIFLLGGYFGACFIQFRRKRAFLAAILALPAGVNSALCALLIPRFGMSGCVAATCCAYIMYFAAIMLYNYRLRNV